MFNILLGSSIFLLLASILAMLSGVILKTNRGDFEVKLPDGTVVEGVEIIGDNGKKPRKRSIFRRSKASMLSHSKGSQVKTSTPKSNYQPYNDNAALLYKKYGLQMPEKIVKTTMGPATPIGTISRSFLDDGVNFIYIGTTKTNTGYFLINSVDRIVYIFAKLSSHTKKGKIYNDCCCKKLSFDEFKNLAKNRKSTGLSIYRVFRDLIDTLESAIEVSMEDYELLNQIRG